MKIVLAIVAASLGLGIGVPTTVHLSHDGWVAVKAAVAPPCAAEDQQTGPCFWDADRRGNGEGRSFYLHTDGTVTFR